VTIQAATVPLEEALETIPHAVNMVGEKPKPSAEVGRTTGYNLDLDTVQPEDVRDELPLPTEEEKATLLRVAAPVPWLTFVLCFVEMAERASYYGVSTVFNNFMEFPLPKGGSGSGAVAKDDPNGTAGAL
jgi:hypothetical protein